jgi:hypothetical protein
MGVALILIGIALVGSRQVLDNLPSALTNIGIVGVLAGVLIAAGGWYAESERQRILTAARKLVFGGPDEIFRKLKEGASHRRELNEMKKLADTIPAEAREPQVYARRGPKEGR